MQDRDAVSPPPLEEFAAQIVASIRPAEPRAGKSIRLVAASLHTDMYTASGRRQSASAAVLRATRRGGSGRRRA